MKKFFGILSLFFCVILASCNFNNLSGKTGSLEFSIPLSDIIQMSRQTSNRSGGGERSDLLCLVQVKGDKGYYVSQTIPQNIKYSDSATENYFLDVPFYNIPVGQTYTVMFDMLVKDDQNGIENLYAPVFSGKSRNVVVSGGKTSEVNIKAEYIKETCLSLKIDFTAGGSKTLKGLTFAQMEASYEDENSGKTDYWELEEHMIAHLSKQNGKLFYSSIDGGQKEVKDIYYVLESNSNFIGSSFKYKIYYTGQETKEYSAYDLNFKNNVCSLKDYLLSQKYFYSSAVVATKDNFIIEFPATCISYFEDGSGSDPYQDILGNYTKLTFTKSSIEGESRYICNIPLSNISDDYAEPDYLQNGDTVVLYFYPAPGLHQSALDNLSQFYYMQQVSDISGLTPENLYEGNNCIAIPTNYTGSLDLIMPLNNVQDVENKQNVMLFFDKTSSEEAFDIYCILVAKKGSNGTYPTYYFTKSANYDYDPQDPTSSPWRFELKYPLGTLPDLKNDGTVTVKITGNFATSEITLTGDLYDSVKLYDGDNGYHTLTKDIPDANLQVMVQDGKLDNNSDSFVFPSVELLNVPNGMDHNYIFQCTAPYSELSPVLLIYNFNLTCETN